MKKNDWDAVFTQLRDDYLEETFLSYGHGAAAENGYKKGVKFRAKRLVSRKLAAVALAACLLLALGATAYATDLYGFRALLRPKETQVQDGLAYSWLSLTYPQALPEGIDPAIAGKIENSEQAWAEYQQYLESSPKHEKFAQLLKTMGLDGNSDAYDLIDNEDGTVTLAYWSGGRKTGETKTFTKEEYEAHLKEIDDWMLYDSAYAYSVNCDEDVRALEEIAAKHGLELRRKVRIVWSSEDTGNTGQDFYTNAQLAEMTAEIGNAGNIFYDTPAGFDKLYWYGEGSFGTSYFVSLPSTGAQVSCYGYNAMYGTLATGTEITVQESDIDSFRVRTHTAADGTELTILSRGGSAYIYVYLENSFFAEQITSEKDLTDADLDYIADFINYSLIGR